MPGTNTLAHLALLSATQEKSFMTLTPDGAGRACLDVAKVAVFPEGDMKFIMNLDLVKWDKYFKTLLSYLQNSNLATVLATFPKIGRFFQTSGHSGSNPP